MKKLFAIFLVALMGCDSSSLDNGDRVMDVVFGQMKFEVPEEYILPGFPPSIVSSGNGLDKSDGVSLKIPLRDMGIDAGRGDSLLDNIIVHVSSSPNSGRLRSDVVDAWRSKGLYKDRVVKYDESLDLYRVYPKSGYPVLWHFFKKHPDEIADDVAESWLAGCMASPGKGESADLSGVTCKSVNFYKTIESEVTWAGENVRLVDAIFSGYEKLLTGWIAK